MKHLLNLIFVLTSLSVIGQAAADPEVITEDLTGIYLKSAGTSAVVGPFVAIAGAIVTGAAYHYDPNSEFVILGVGLSVVGVGISLSGGFSLIKAGKQYELNHKK